MYSLYHHSSFWLLQSQDVHLQILKIKKTWQPYYRNCSVMEYNTWEYNFYEIIQVWGMPTDTLYFSKKALKMNRNLGVRACLKI